MYVSAIYGSTEKLRAWLNGPACCLANLSGTRLGSFFEAFIYSSPNKVVRALNTCNHAGPRSWWSALERFFESEQRPEKHTFETPKERDGEREGERRRQVMLSGICITLVWRNARDLFTFSILWTRMRPLLGLANRSPEMISNSFSSFLPSARSVNRSSTSIRA